MVEVLEFDQPNQSEQLVRKDDHVHHDQTVGKLGHQEGLNSSRSSSYYSTTSAMKKMERDDCCHKDYSKVGSPTRSVHSSMTGSGDRHEHCSERGSPARSMRSAMEVCFCSNSFCILADPYF